MFKRRKLGREREQELVVHRTSETKFSWKIMNIITVLSDNTIKEYHTEKSLYDSCPQLKMQLLGEKNDLIEFYYLCPVTVYLMYTMKITVYSDIEGKGDAKKIEANKWHYLGNILKRDIYSERESNDNKFPSLTFNMEFIYLNNNSFPKYSSNLSGVTDKSIFADVVIKTNDGKEYKAHKFTLARNSAVFKAHFEHDTTESRTNVVEAPFESDVVEEIISYMYSEEILKMNKIPEKILAAADFYQLDGLKKLCAEEITKQLTIENATKILDLADLYHEDNLKIAALVFIKQGIEKLINPWESWETAMSVDDIKSIYKYVEKKQQIEFSIVNNALLI